LSERNQGYFRLLYEVDGLVLQDRAKYASEFSGAGIATWLNLLEGFSEFSGYSDSRARATFVHATLNGLIQDFLATGDRKRTTEALNILLQTLSLQLAEHQTVRSRA
jgi:hypothetical protein